MSTSSVTRPQTPEERSELEGMLRRLPSSLTRLRRGIGSFVALWAAVLLGLMLGWAAVAWFARRTFYVEVGWQGQSALTILATLILGATAFAGYSTLQWLRGWPDPRPQLRKDLSAGEVIEERHRFVEAKVFQEPEHGGLLYFLRTNEGKVWPQFDHESQELGVQGGEPRQSSFRPRDRLTVIRAPRTRFVIQQGFTGKELVVSEPHELIVKPSLWPVPEEYCSVTWDELEKRFSPQRT